jgi:hypothetical protein
MIRISSVLANPEGTDKGAEYISLLNEGSDSEKLFGWNLVTSAGKKIPVNGEIKAGESLKIFTGSTALKNSGETLTLVDVSGKKVDSFSYAVAGEGQVLSPAEFLSIEEKEKLFEESVFTVTNDNLKIGGQGISWGIASSAILIGVALAFCAVFVLKQVSYDDLVESPFKREKNEKTKD